ncbi:hypothetical protein [Candidatus Electronema sp. PJ]|uniref:hypothetical protein n=1 Tax=Candidatus Electronema sp. PJ TaxID=3401572 RepID=UPI003AA82042
MIYTLLVLQQVLLLQNKALICLHPSSFPCYSYREKMMTQENYFEQIQQELIKTPAEYLPALLNIIHTFRESICMNSAEESFKTGWSEIQKGQYEPISKLWDGIAR